MSKVLVDRELLERVCLRQSIGMHWNAIEELEGALAQPAEAVGVESFDLGDGSGARVVYADDHLTALSAVTAERDRLRAARMAYASEFALDENGEPDIGRVHENIRALKKELAQYQDLHGKLHPVERVFLML